MLLLSEHSPSASSAGSASYQRQVALAVGRACHISIEMHLGTVETLVVLVASVEIAVLAALGVWLCAVVVGSLSAESKYTTQRVLAEASIREPELQHSEEALPIALVHSLALEQ